MFAFVQGKLVKASPTSVIIETGGIGYRIYIPVNVYSKLPQIGQTTLMHTSYIVRELSHTLYGFLAVAECEVFETLMGVTGIGPKLALSLIGHLPLIDLQRAIASNDLVTICKVPGIGKKTAERLMIELRDKLSTYQSEDPSDKAFPMPHNIAQQKISDAMGALVNLGYNQATAQKAIKKTLQDSSTELDLAGLITISLKHI